MTSGWGGNFALPTMWLGILQVPPLLQNSCAPPVPQDNGSLGNTCPRGSKVTGRPLLLSVVWQRGTEQGDCGESPLHQALLPQTSMQEVFVVFYHHIGQNVVSCPRMSTHAFPQRQWRQRSRKV